MVVDQLTLTRQNKQYQQKILKKNKKGKNKYRKKRVKTHKIILKQAGYVKLSKVVD